ncbi:hypothetical protein VNO80_27244 [Phaseolus coccineus]|uniref:Uncharacterized protein n=1 Tax=Phaseolus coccineus TaxID=3886 RepID=A0AAN9QL58_PHACN
MGDTSVVCQGETSVVCQGETSVVCQGEESVVRQEEESVIAILEASVIAGMRGMVIARAVIGGWLSREVTQSWYAQRHHVAVLSEETCTQASHRAFSRPSLATGDCHRAPGKVLCKFPIKP